MPVKYLKQLWNEKPFLVIILLAAFVRLIAAILSKGYGMHDDHFLVIEPSQAWVDGTDYDNWLPKNQVNPVPQGHSFFYVGIHYLLFLFLKFAGISNPQVKMLIVRLIHAAFSMIIVTAGYRIAGKISGGKAARQVGILLALLWFMPFMSVHNLVEIVCIPFLMLGIWMILKSGDTKNDILKYAAAGLVMGIAFSVRFQSLLFIGGTALALLFTRKWYHAIAFGTGALIMIFIIQGITDFFIWGYPFAELKEYVRYNIEARNEYLTDSWYKYLLLICGIIIPPLGLFHLFGFLRTKRKYLLLFLPAIIFLVFHSMFPNKQERFIFPIIPFFVILGVAGWQDFTGKSKFWLRNTGLMKGCLLFFWIINIILLAFVTPTYSKKSRVESMTYLSHYPDINNLMIEDTNRGSTVPLPLFYLGHWANIYQLSQEVSKKTASHYHSLESLDYFRSSNPAEYPEFILFFGDKNLDGRLKNVMTIFPSLQYETRIDPGFTDRFMTWINPANKNESMYIYRNVSVNEASGNKHQ